MSDLAGPRGAPVRESGERDRLPARPVHDRKIADIELLRGVAILFVLVEHLPLNLFPWGVPGLQHLYAYFRFWSGVDLFFAISGFVIARSLLPKLAACSDTVSFVNATIVFWVRRAWRLLPSAWLWLMLILAAALLFNRTGAFGLFHANFMATVAGMLDVANFRMMMVYGHTFYGASFPYWSLSLEEQFYLLLPFLVLVSGRRLPIVLAVMVVAQLFLDRQHLRLPNMIRSDALLLGVLIALWTRHSTYRLVEPAALKRSALGRWATLSVLIASLAAVSVTEPALIPFPFGVVALISAVLVLIASYDQDYLMRDGAIKRVLVWIGSRSYTLYLVHAPAYLATREIWSRIEPPGTNFGGTYTLRFVLTAVALMVTLTELNYRLVETPLRLKGARIAERLAARTRAPEAEAAAYPSQRFSTVPPG